MRCYIQIKMQDGAKFSKKYCFGFGQETNITIIKSYSVYDAVTSSDLFYLSLYQGGVTLVPFLAQYAPGIGVGMFLEYKKSLPPDFSTGLKLFDLGVSSGSLLYLYLIDPIIYPNHENKDKTPD